MKSFTESRLYTFIDLAYVPAGSVVRVARQLCEGGSDLIQLRAKNFSEKEVRNVALQLLPITRDHGVGLVINDHLEMAIELQPDAVHLGQEDFAGRESDWAQLKQMAGIPIGLSTHEPEQGQAAQAWGVDYAGVGPVYQTATKPHARPVGLEYVRWAAGHLTIPWFAIGGIDLENLDEVIEAGARRICVVSAILKARDIRHTCQEFKNRLTSAAIA